MTQPALGQAGDTDLARAVLGSRSSDLAGYLEEVEAFLLRYVAFPSEHESVAVALWVAHAHVVDRFDTSPILAITSPEKRSGKTRLQDCLNLVVPHPFRCVIPSEAVAYTLLSQRPRPTMLMDEADAIFRGSSDRYEGLRAILNSGNRKGTPVPRVKLEGRRRDVELFDVYGPKAIAGIGKLPDTVADRAIPIRLKRRAPSQQVEPFRERVARSEVRDLAFPSVDVPLVPDVPFPQGLVDRAADSWEPLLVIADLAGGEWPARAREAAVMLSTEDAYDLSLGVRLLSDVRAAFTQAGTDHLPTHTLLAALHAMEDAPWGDFYGRPLTPHRLAQFLERYGVTPAQQRIEGEKQRGYWRSDLADAWDRYLPPWETGTSGTTGTAATQMALDIES